MNREKLNLLCIDDDPICLEQIHHALAPVADRFRFHCATTPTEAINLHKNKPADIVITDLKMSEMDGIRLIERMKHINRNTIYMLLSGHADLDTALAAINDIHAFRFLTKPVSSDALRHALDAAILEINLLKLKLILHASHSAVESLRIGIAYLNDARQLTYANGSAKHIFATTGFFQIGTDRILRCMNTKETYEFHDFLENVRACRDDAGKHAVFRFRGRNITHFLFASANYHPRDGDNEAYYSIVFSNPDGISPTSETIAQALNILPSEAKLVHALTKGGGIEAAARKCGISPSSARTYLKNVFSKTGVSRQSELVHLVMLISI